MSTYRVLLAFTRLPDAALNVFGQTVVTMMTNNPGFTTPLVPLAEITAKQQAFQESLEAMGNGGKQATAAKNVAREDLLGVLRPQAAYVQGVAGEDLAVLLSSGFETVNTNRTQIPLPKPVIESIDNPMSTKLGVKVVPVPTAAAYEVRISYGVNGWQGVGVFTSSRSILIDGLTPGTTYNVQTRAVGGSTGYSDWSDPVSHMAL
jgi:hypothetical protein